MFHGRAALALITINRLDFREIDVEPTSSGPECFARDVEN
jgi:hypothetical protein